MTLNDITHGREIWVTDAQLAELRFGLILTPVPGMVTQQILCMPKARQMPRKD